MIPGLQKFAVFSLHNLCMSCVLTMIFRLLLMKSIMTCSQRVLLTLHHNMSKPVRRFIHHFPAQVQRILRLSAGCVPAQ